MRGDMDHGGLQLLLPRLFAFARAMLSDAESARDLVHEARQDHRRAGIEQARSGASRNHIPDRYRRVDADARDIADYLKKNYGM